MSGGAPQGAAGLGAPVLLIGADGMLGRAWGHLLKLKGVAHACPGLDELDLTRDQSVAKMARGPWRTYVNCAAWTDVDGSETRPDEAMAVNRDGVRRLAAACAENGALLVHYSTDYVFDGRAARPYPVDAPRAPQNSYGKSKLAGELAIEASSCRSLIVRTSWLYAPWGKNFVRTIAKAAREKPALKVVHDQRGRPTSAEHLAATTLRLIDAGAGGAFHVTDGGECSWYELAAEVAGSVNPTCRVSPCTTAEYPRPAARPAYSVLDLAGTEAILGPMPHWKENLADCLRRLEPL